MAEETKTEEKKEEVQEEVSKEEVKTKEDTPEESKKEVEIPKKFKSLVDEIESMTVLELHELVKLLEEKFGVSAAAVAVAGPGAQGGDDDEEKDSFTVELTAFGDSKINVIKAVKNVLGLGLKEAKDLVEAAPTTLKEGVKKEDAEAMKQEIETAGGTITLK